MSEERTEREKALEVVYWHLDTAQNAVQRLRELVESREPGQPIPNQMHVRDVASLVAEHMEGLQFEYERLRELEDSEAKDD